MTIDFSKLYLDDDFYNDFEEMDAESIRAYMHDAYMQGFEKGYHQASMVWMDECKKVRDALRAILDKGETPEDAGSKVD